MKMIIKPSVYAKVMYLVDKCDKEISGLGRVKIIGNEVHVVDVYLLKQTVTGSTTDIDGEAVSKLMYECYKDGGIEQGELLWWWHSHVDMEVFWSGTDMATIKDFGGKGRIFATVFNKRRQMKSAYFQAPTDKYPELFVDNIQTEITENLSDAEIKQLDSEFNKLVKEPKYEQPTWNKHATGYHGGKRFPNTMTLREIALEKARKQRELAEIDNWRWNDDMPSVFTDPDFYSIATDNEQTNDNYASGMDSFIDMDDDEQWALYKAQPKAKTLMGSNDDSGVVRVNSRKTKLIKGGKRGK